MTHKGWRVVKTQHNQSNSEYVKIQSCFETTDSLACPEGVVNASMLAEHMPDTDPFVYKHILCH